MSPPSISSCSWLSLTKLSFCHKNAAVAANSGILKHLGEIFRPTCCCDGLILNLSRDNFCPALATPLESRTVRRTVLRTVRRTVRNTVRSCVRPDPTTDSSTDHRRTIDGHIDGHRTQLRTVRRTVRRTVLRTVRRTVLPCKHYISRYSWKAYHLVCNKHLLKLKNISVFFFSCLKATH